MSISNWTGPWKRRAFRVTERMRLTLKETIAVKVLVALPPSGGLLLLPVAELAALHLSESVRIQVSLMTRASAGAVKMP